MKRSCRMYEGARVEAVLEALIAALHNGRSGPLDRLAKQAGLDFSEARRAIQAFPRRECAALREQIALALDGCTAQTGCQVATACPLVTHGQAASLTRSAVAIMARDLIGGSEKSFPAAPLESLEQMRGAVLEMLRLLPTDAPPRARTSLVILDLAIARGAPLGVAASFLRSSEVEQVAAFLPPDSSSEFEHYRQFEGWLRLAASSEAAIVAWN